VRAAQAKLLCAQKISHAKSLLKFIRTETVPPVLWQPVALNDDLENLYVVRRQLMCYCHLPMRLCACTSDLVSSLLPAPQPRRLVRRLVLLLLFAAPGMPASCDGRSADSVDVDMQQQENDFALWADAQAGRLHEEQQAMRQKAEARWSELDEAMAAQQRARDAQRAPPCALLPATC
jgi:hypothetical protein